MTLAPENADGLRQHLPVFGPLADLRLGLTEHGHDDDLGRIDLKGRVYDPALKRVLTPDPIVSMPLFGQSYNRYFYVLNAPVNLVDPTRYQAGSGPDCGICQLWVVPPIIDSGGIQGSGSSSSTAWGSVPQKTDWGEFQSLPPPPLALSLRGGELARAHDADVLLAALGVRLDLDGFHTLGRLISRSAEAEARGPSARAVFFAIASIGRLRIEGRGELADAVVAALSGRSDVAPALWRNEAHALIHMGREVAARHRAQGLLRPAEDVAANAWTYLRSVLVRRLEADGREDLARAVSAASRVVERQERVEQAPQAEHRVSAAPREPRPERGAQQARIDGLARAHPADVLAHAAVTRLRAQGRDTLAASIMMFWAREIAGPMVDPGQTAAELLARLRAQGHGELADTIAQRLRGAALDRDSCDIMARRLHELARPMIDAAPLAATLVAALRDERHEALADRVEALLLPHAWMASPRDVRALRRSLPASKWPRSSPSGRGAR